MPAHAPSSPMRDGTVSFMGGEQQPKRRFDHHHHQTVAGLAADEEYLVKRCRLFVTPPTDSMFVSPQRPPPPSPEDDSQRQFGVFYNSMQLHSNGQTLALATSSSSPIDLAGVANSGMLQLDRHYRDTYVDFFNQQQQSEHHNASSGHLSAEAASSHQNGMATGHNNHDDDDVDMEQDDDGLHLSQLFNGAPAAESVTRVTSSPTSPSADTQRHLGNYSPSLVFCRPFAQTPDRCCLYPYSNDYY